MLPAVFSAESLGHDFVDTLKEQFVDDFALDTHCPNKEYEYNQFFISAETSSHQEKSTGIVSHCGEQIHDGNAASVVELTHAPEHNDKHVKPLDLGIFHGILESDDLDILPSARSCVVGTHDSGLDYLRESDDDVDEAGTSDKKLGVIEDISEKTIATRATIAEAQSFLKDIRQHSDARSRILEEVLFCSLLPPLT
ncbi:hypothetical protein L7F22_060632 [Adiantum nelumboides]|nr:hypothetical protein [Adiantum nelumboides]